jgi:hypothetical protein
VATKKPAEGRSGCHGGGTSSCQVNELHYNDSPQRFVDMKLVFGCPTQIYSIHNQPVSFISQMISVGFRPLPSANEMSVQEEAPALMFTVIELSSPVQVILLC